MSSPEYERSGSLPIELELDMRELEVERELAARASRDDLRTFSNFVFGLDFPVHLSPVIEALEAIEAGQIRRLLVILPPGHAKSTLCSIAFPAWMIGRHRDQHFIGISTTDKLAGAFGDTVRDVIEGSENYRVTFPEARPDYARGWSQDGFYVTRPWAPFDKDPTGYYVGAGGSIIGKRADGLLIDDPIDEQVARSETMLEQRKTWLKRSATSRLKPGGWIVLRMRAESASRLVYADVTIPESVEWRPTGFEEGRPQ
jgi:hypothetical protein